MALALVTTVIILHFSILNSPSSPSTASYWVLLRSILKFTSKWTMVFNLCKVRSFHLHIFSLILKMIFAELTSLVNLSIIWWFTWELLTIGSTDIPCFIALYCFIVFLVFFYKSKVCGNPALSKCHFFQQYLLILCLCVTFL